MNINMYKQRGAVSLFVVVFAALLITIVTVSFVRIMVQNQQQASTTDLSQSAYDSAQAGVEDAKRALLRYQSICSGDITKCDDSKINSLECNIALDQVEGVTLSGGEVKVQTDKANALDQAYTCVKINLDTIDYLGTLSANESRIVPLTGVGSFDTVQIQWFSSKDISSDKNYEVNLQKLSEGVPLLAQNSWAINRPSILRTQLIQIGGFGFILTDFDKIVDVGGGVTQSNANTLFLYPTGTTGSVSSTISEETFKGHDTRLLATGVPLPIACSGNLEAGGYACTVKLTLPTPIGAGERISFLRLSALYNKTNYRVTLLDSTKICDQTTGIGAGCVKFDAVQPEIDSTGRANDLFRRVQTRVELIDVNFPYPEATVVETDGNFCKDFRVTDSVDDYLNSCPIINEP